MKKYLLFIFGMLSFIFGVIGAILPVVPTTPFMILAAYFFTHSSPKMREKILRLPGVGELVLDWEKSKVIKPRAKVMCVFIIILVIGSSIYRLQEAFTLKALLVITGICVSTFVLTRKSHP